MGKEKRRYVVRLRTTANVFETNSRIEGFVGSDMDRGVVEILVDRAAYERVAAMPEVASIQACAA